MFDVISSLFEKVENIFDYLFEIEEYLIGMVQWFDIIAFTIFYFVSLVTMHYLISSFIVWSIYSSISDFALFIFYQKIHRQIQTSDQESNGGTWRYAVTYFILFFYGNVGMCGAPPIALIEKIDNRPIQSTGKGFSHLPL